MARSPGPGPPRRRERAVEGARVDPRAHGVVRVGDVEDRDVERLARVLHPGERVGGLDRDARRAEGAAVQGHERRDGREGAGDGGLALAAGDDEDALDGPVLQDLLHREPVAPADHEDAPRPRVQRERGVDEGFVVAAAVARRGAERAAYVEAHVAGAAREADRAVADAVAAVAAAAAAAAGVAGVAGVEVAGEHDRRPEASLLAGAVEPAGERVAGAEDGEGERAEGALERGSAQRVPEQEGRPGGDPDDHGPEHGGRVHEPEPRQDRVRERDERERGDGVEVEGLRGEAVEPVAPARDAGGERDLDADERAEGRREAEEQGAERGRLEDGERGRDERRRPAADRAREARRAHEGGRRVAVAEAGATAAAGAGAAQAPADEQAGGRRREPRRHDARQPRGRPGEQVRPDRAGEDLVDEPARREREHAEEDQRLAQVSPSSPPRG